MWAVGIDPGQTGALALVEGDGRLGGLVDMPLNGKRADADELGSTLMGWQGAAHSAGEELWVALEIQNAAKMGRTSAFNHGFLYGQLYQEAMRWADRFVEVRPQKWQADIGCTVGGKAGPEKRKRLKEKSRLLCQQRWRVHSTEFGLVKHDGRADGGNIAHWLTQQ